MNENGFLPDGYEAPKGNNVNYAKIEKGENKFRILSKPILGWLDWKEKKPLRFKMDAKPSPIDPSKPVKHFWAFVVWNYKAEMIQILEITQSTIQTAIQGLYRDNDWGNPFKYDIKVIRSGDGMDTQYQVNPVPHKEVTQQVITAYMAKGDISLEKLYEGGDPFENSAPPPPPPADPISTVKEMPF